MRIIFSLCAIILVYVFESRITILDVSPNLSAAIAYFFGLRNGETKGIFLGSFVGLLGDTLTGNFLGPNILSKGLVGFFASFLSGSFFRWTPVLGIAGISVLTAIDGIVVFITMSAFQYTPTSIVNAGSIILISSGINSILGLLLRPRHG
ncbi:MAG: hypothetical protein LLF28_00585 [Nitrospiraceae bacterium]|nr:hypothetical protein [Nitrospiraceae bacterium]